MTIQEADVRSGHTCKEDGCNETVTARGLCNRCYNRRWQRGQIDVAHPWRGCLPDDIDELAVDRAVAGDIPETLTRFERREAVRVLRDQGLSLAQISRRLRMSVRQVSRDAAQTRVGNGLDSVVSHEKMGSQVKTSPTDACDADRALTTHHLKHQEASG